VSRESSVVFYILKPKNKAMKKIFAIVTIASLLAACNNSSEEKNEVLKDSTNTESPLMDAVNTADSANKIMQDSTGKLKDSIMEK
jgi:hypothetical protein